MERLLIADQARVLAALAKALHTALLDATCLTGEAATALLIDVDRADRQDLAQMRRALADPSAL